MELKPIDIAYLDPYDPDYNPDTLHEFLYGEEDDYCTDAERYGYDEDTCRANVEECGGL